MLAFQLRFERVRLARLVAECLEELRRIGGERDLDRPGDVAMTGRAVPSLLARRTRVEDAAAATRAGRFVVDVAGVERRRDGRPRERADERDDRGDHRY